MGLGQIYTSCFLGEFIVFGGNTGFIGFINWKNRVYLRHKIEVSPQYIFSIEFCWIKHKESESKALLTTSGIEYDDSLKTDVFDITRFISNQIKSNQK